MSLIVGRCSRCAKTRVIAAGEVVGYFGRVVLSLVVRCNSTGVLCGLDNCIGELLYIGQYTDQNIPRPAYDSAGQLLYPDNAAGCAVPSLS